MKVYDDNLFVVMSDADVTYVVDCFRDSYVRWEGMANGTEPETGAEADETEPDASSNRVREDMYAAARRYGALLEQVEASHKQNLDFGGNYLVHKKAELAVLNEVRANNNAAKKARKPLAVAERKVRTICSTFVVPI